VGVPWRWSAARRIWSGEYPRQVQVSTAKQKMRDGRPAYGYGLSLGSAFAAELLSRSGIDWLPPDTQYGASGHDAAFAALVAMAGGTPTPLARVARDDLATPGVDGCWAGPADLALSKGLDPRKASEDERYGRALEKILEACRHTGKVPGLACPTSEDARRRADQGWQFLTAGADAGFMLSVARAGLDVFAP
jgi:2-keto-3-deoxy-L-rhamnonate aldolase RhmA